MKYHCYDNNGVVTVVPVYRTNLHEPYPEGQPAMGYVDGAPLSPVIIGPHLGKRVSFQSLPFNLQVKIASRLPTR